MFFGFRPPRTTRTRQYVAPILPDDLRKIEMQISSMIQHENELLNHRIQWFLTLNGFLFTAVALYGNQPGRNYFGWVLAGLGLLVCSSFFVGLSIGGQGFKRLVRRWKMIKAMHSEGFEEVGVYGHLAKGFLENNLAPWKALPMLMAFGWIAVAIFVGYYPGQNPTGTYTPLIIQEQQAVNDGAPIKKNRIILYDTRSGKLLRTD
jgi:hypothetical protein